MIKKSPDSLLIVGVILLLFTGLTWLVPAGEYDRVLKAGKQVVVGDSFHYVEAAPQGIVDVLRAPIRGFESAAEIIAFVLLVGGAFSLFSATGAFDAFFFWILKRVGKNANSRGVIVALLMAVFSFGGMTFGMSEETLVFVLVTIPLARSLGYDHIVGIAIPFVGAGVGFAGAAYNPFTVGIAQGIADLPLFSGAPYRLVIWTVFTAIAILYVLQYARKVRLKNIKGFYPENADSSLEEVKSVEMTKGRAASLILFMIGLVLIAYGAMEEGWYIAEICALFIALGLIAAVLNRGSAESYVNSFYHGVKSMVPAAMVICLSKSILVIADDGKIIDTVLHSMAGLVEGLPGSVSAQIMFVVQGGLNFFIPSGSGQAAVTMPIMAPFSDLVGVGRQTAVLAYQLGDGLFNLIIPTSGVTMGILSIGGVPFNKWIKWVGKLMIILVLISFVFLMLPTTFFTW